MSFNHQSRDAEPLHLDHRPDSIALHVVRNSGINVRERVKHEHVASDFPEARQPSPPPSIVYDDGSIHDATTLYLVGNPRPLWHRHDTQRPDAEYRCDKYRRGRLVFHLCSEMRTEDGAIGSVVRIAFSLRFGLPLRHGRDLVVQQLG